MHRTDCSYQVLDQLYACRPDRVLFDELKRRLPQFSALPDSEWIEVLRQLSECGLADVARIPSGSEGRWGVVVNAGISGLGTQEIEQIRALEYYGDQLFAGWSVQAYEDLARVGVDLRGQFAHRGCLGSTSFWRAAVDVVFERFKGFEEAFIRSYLRPLLERTEDGLNDLRQAWLEGKLAVVLDREFRRAKGLASSLCDVAGTSSSAYAAQINELDIRAEEVRDRIARKIRIARIEQALPAVRGEAGGTRTGQSPAQAASQPAKEESAPECGITLDVQKVCYTAEFNGVVVVVDFSSRLPHSDQVTDWTLDLPSLGTILQGGPGRANLQVGADWLPAPPFDLPGMKMTRGAVFFPCPHKWRTGPPQEPLHGKLTARLFVFGLLEKRIEVYSLSTLKAGLAATCGTEQAFAEEGPHVTEHPQRSRDLEALKQEFLALDESEDRQRAGSQLEKILNRLFSLHGLSPRGPFRVVGEEIDGSFELDHEVYLLEAKWHQEPSPAAHLTVFREKIEGKSKFTRGVFVSINGVSKEAADAITRGKQPNFFIVDGHDIAMLLEDRMDLALFLRCRQRLLAEEGRVVVPFSDLARSEGAV